MMSHKKSYNTTQKNKGTWTDNLVRFQQLHKRRQNVATVVSSLEEYCMMPLQLQIIGRYQFLGADIKGRNERVAKMSEEVKNLWQNKLNFPHLSNQVIHTKLHKVLKTYDECVRRGKFDTLDQLFDITKVNGQWLSNDDKRLYQLQLESKGEIGYSTSKVARKETIHPSKKQKLPTESVSLSTSVSHVGDVSSSIEFEKESSEYENEINTHLTTRKHKKKKKQVVATNLVTSTNVSTRKAAKICK